MKKKMIQTIKKVIKNPYILFVYAARRRMLDWMPDVMYLMVIYRARLGKFPDLNNPKAFNEKIQWLKLHDRNPEYIDLVDKNAVKSWVAEHIGSEYVIPTLGLWNTFDEICFKQLPQQFVIKCTHDSGGVIIVKDKNEFNKKLAKEKLEKSLSRNYYWVGREWPYKNVSPKIIVEEDIADGKAMSIDDYKFLCFNGVVKCSFVCTERRSRNGLHVTFFDRDWNEMSFERHYPKSVTKIPKPVNYEKMIELAETLAKDFPFVRVDFYEVHGKIYFGELTFYPGNGFEEFTPEEWDYRLGEWLVLKTDNIGN